MFACYICTQYTYMYIIWLGKGYVYLPDGLASGNWVFLIEEEVESEHVKTNASTLGSLYITARLEANHS